MAGGAASVGDFDFEAMASEIGGDDSMGMAPPAPSDGSESSSPEELAYAADIQAAMSSGDPEALAKSLKDFVRACAPGYGSEQP